MKNIYLISFVVTTLLLGGCVSKKAQVTPKKTKSLATLNLSQVNYPSKIGDYTLEHKRDFPTKNLGTTVRYTDHKNSKGYLDCHLYPQGKDRDLKHHYDDLISALKYMHKKGELSEFKILQEDSVDINSPQQTLRAVFEMANKNTAYYSVLYLTKVADHYYKIRISHPKREHFLKSDLGEKSAKELLNKIMFKNSQ